MLLTMSQKKSKSNYSGIFLKISIFKVSNPDYVQVMFLTVKYQTMKNLFKKMGTISHVRKALTFDCSYNDIFLIFCFSCFCQQTARI